MPARSSARQPAPPPAAGSSLPVHPDQDDAAAGRIGQPSRDRDARRAIGCYSGSGIHSVTGPFSFDAQMAAILSDAHRKAGGLTGLGDVSCWYND
jgi:hypothetical protein